MMSPEETPTTNDRPRSDIAWFASCAAVTTLGAFLRFYWLALKPFHHDEGVNGFFLTNLSRDGVYKYDPANYHGPTLYYISLAFAEVFGLETVPIRWSVAVWGLLTVVLAFYLRPYVGRTGSLAAAFFLAISPGMVYISRYFIHEIFFIFLSLAFVLAILLYIEREKAGPGAVAWMSLVLFVCFVPPVLRLAPLIASGSETALWTARIGLFVVEATLIFFVVRMLREWNDGRPIYLMLAAASFALLFATKETAFITLGTMAVACFCVWTRERIADSARENSFPAKTFVIALIGSVAFAAAVARKLPDAGEQFGKWMFDLIEAGTPDAFASLFYMIIAAVPALLVGVLFWWDRRDPGPDAEVEYYQPSLSRFRAAAGSGLNAALLAIACAAIVAYLIVLFFSSFFTYPDGVNGFFEAYAIWAKTGSKDHTQNGIWAYIDWGMRSDGPIMVLALVGTVLAVLKGRQRFAVFAGLWGLGLFVAYTLIPYKTPWLALSFLLPMCISAGYAIGEMFDSKNSAAKGGGALLAVAAALILAYQTFDLNFVRYDDEDAPMVYAHTRREFLDMVRDIERFAEVSGKGKDASIDIVSPDYWPLVWYLKDHPKAIFHGKIADSTAEVIVAKKGEQNDAVIRKYSTNYKYYRSYELRSGVDLMVLVRRDLIGGDGMELYRINSVGDD